MFCAGRHSQSRLATLGEKVTSAENLSLTIPISKTPSAILNSPSAEEALLKLEASFDTKPLQISNSLTGPLPAAIPPLDLSGSLTVSDTFSPLHLGGSPNLNPNFRSPLATKAMPLDSRVSDATLNGLIQLVPGQTITSSAQGLNANSIPVLGFPVPRSQGLNSISRPESSLASQGINLAGNAVSTSQPELRTERSDRMAAPNASHNMGALKLSVPGSAFHVTGPPKASILVITDLDQHWRSR